MMKNYVLILLYCFVIDNTKAQNVFDITASGVYKTHEEICQIFLFSFLSLDSTKYKSFYSVEILNIIIDQSRKETTSEEIKNFDFVASEEKMFSIYSKTFNRNYRYFCDTRGFIDTSNIEIVKIKIISYQEKFTPQFEYDDYVLEIIFKNKSNDKEHSIVIYDATVVNNKWYIFFPTFTIR